MPTRPINRSEDRGSWGIVFPPLFLREALALCALLPGALAECPEPTDQDAPLHPDPDISKEIRRLVHAQELELRFQHRRAILSLLCYAVPK